MADKMCNYCRDLGEPGGYFFLSTKWNKEVDKKTTNTYYDSNTGKPLFTAPVDRKFKEFEAESCIMGWPSFRDKEVNWNNVCVLKSGETVSRDGTHLGHNIPDKKGNKYIVNIVSIAGRPEKELL